MEGNSDEGEFLLFPKGTSMPGLMGTLGPTEIHTQSSPGVMMWLQVCTAEQINNNISVLSDSAASLEFNLLKLFEERKYAELILKRNPVLSCSCSTVWCFQVISELLGWVFLGFFFHWLLKGTQFYHVVLKLEYFNFVDILSWHPWNP